LKGGKNFAGFHPKKTAGPGLASLPGAGEELTKFPKKGKRRQGEYCEKGSIKKIVGAPVGRKMGVKRLRGMIKRGKGCGGSTVVAQRACKKWRRGGDEHNNLPSFRSCWKRGIFGKAKRQEEVRKPNPFPVVNNAHSKPERPDWGKLNASSGAADRGKPNRL